MKKTVLPLLAGKRILVTGGASGIGLGSAALFVRMGAEVFLCDNNEAGLAAAVTETGAAGAIRCDVSVEADCEATIAEALNRLGGLDGMLHCAGIADVVSKVHDLDLDVWQRIVDINLRGTFLMARAIGRPFLAQGSGSIVNVSSVTGLNGFPRRNAYGPAKAAVALLTRNLASEWGGAGIRVNAIAPGYIRTPMVAALLEADRIDVKRVEGRTPMGRLGEVDEVGDAAAFLLSDLASYVTGTILPVDGGWAAFSGAGEVETA